MAVDVSKIPNNNKFDPVREAILQLQEDIQAEGQIAYDGEITVSKSTGSTITITGGSFSVNQSNNTNIIIGIDDSGYYSTSGGEIDGNVDITGNLVVEGNLTVSGTTTYINTNHLNIGDNIITLNADLPSGDAPSENAGIEINRGSSTNVDFLWNETSNEWDLQTYSGARIYRYGVGSTTLTIEAGSTAGDAVIALTPNTTGTGGVIQTTNERPIAFQPNSTTKMVIASGGDVNIYDSLAVGKTGAPSYALDVTGDGSFTGDVTANSFIGDLTGNADTATNADKVDNKHATDFTLDYVTDNGNSTTNSITVGRSINFSNVDYTYIEGNHTDAADGDWTMRMLGYAGGTFMGSFDIGRIDSDSGFLRLRQKINGTNTNVVDVSDGDVDILEGNFKVGGTTVIDSSRNINGVDGILSGNLGVGVTSNTSGFKLDVAGSGLFDNAVVISGTETGNPSALTDQIRVSGYGILGNRATFYVTNGGGVVQIGNGSNHNADPTATFGSSGITLLKDTTVSGDTTLDGLVGINTTPSSDYQLNMQFDNTDANDDFHFAQRIDGNFSGADNTTGDREQGGIWLDIDSSADGDADNEHRLYGIYSDVRHTGFSDAVYSGYFRAESNNSTESTSTLNGILAAAVHDSGDNGGVFQMMGIYGYSSVEDAGSVENAYGGYFLSNASTTRTENVGRLIGVRAEAQIDAEAELSYSDVIGIESIVDNNEDTLPTGTNTYLFKGEYQGTRYATNAWGLYVDGDKHYLEGSVQIGSLDVGGNTVIAGNLQVDDKITITGTTNNLLIDEIADGTWHIYDTFQDNGIKIYSGTGGIEFQYNGVTEMTIDGGGVTFNGTVDLSDASLNIGSADVIFGIDATDTGARGLIWSFDADGNGTASYIGYIRAGGTLVGEVLQFNINSNGTVTGSDSIYEFKNGGTDVVTIGADGSVTTGRITIANNASTGGFSNASDFQILLYDTGTVTRNYGIGIESNTMMFNSDDNYRFYVDNAVVSTINTDNTIVNGNIQSLSQIRATGWYNTETGSQGDLAFEIGVSAGVSHAISYNRNTSSYGDITFAAVNFNFEEKGGTTTIANNEIWHAGNDGAGSGLDADTVDGLQANQFLRADTNDEKTGWLKVYSAIGAGDNVRTGLAHYDTTAMAEGVGGQLVVGYKYTSAGDYTEGAIIKMFKENGTSDEYGSGLKFQVRNHAEDLNTKMRLSPSGKLSLGDSPYNGGVYAFNSSTEEDDNWGMEISWSGSPSTDYHTKLKYYPVAGENRAAGIWNSQLNKFSLYSDSNTEPNIIVPYGKLGVGQESPYMKLHVVGDSGVNNGSFFLGNTSGGNSAMQFYKSGADLRIYRNEGSFGGSYTADNVNLQIYSGSTYSVNIAGNGTTYFNGGNVGIGTTSPTGTYGKLSVAGGISILDDNNAKLEIGRYSSGAPNAYIKLGANANSLRFTNNTDTADLFTITNGGNVGIGTTSPSEKLEVNGTIKLGGYSYIGEDLSDLDSLTIACDHTESIHFAHKNGGTYTTKMILNSSGNVGIGTASPSKKLHIKSSDNEGIFMEGTGGGHWFNFKAGTSNLWSMGAQSGLMGWYNRTNSSYKMVITDAGLVGIGKTSPNAKLDVAGEIRSSYSSGHSLRLVGAGGGNAQIYGTDFYYGMNLSNSQTSSSYYLMSLNSGVGNVMYVRCDGNVGIGTTSPSAKFQVSKNGNNGSSGLGDYGIVTVASSGQATIGVIHSGDGYANLNLGGTSNFWHISKRLSTDNYKLEYYWYDGSGFTSRFEFMTNGDFKAGGDIIAYKSSDKRLKDNVKTTPNALEKIQSIGGYEFDWNDSQETYKGHDVGVIAQEIEEVLPEAVTTRDSGYKGVQYEKLVPLLIEAIKDQQKQIDELKARLDGITN